MSDLISRKWLMESIEQGWIKFDTETDLNRTTHLIRDIAPSAEPKETAQRVLNGKGGEWTGADWQGTRLTRYKCPNCLKFVRNDETYCHKCGQHIIFPAISFTKYVPGEKQKIIVRWDDE